MNGSTASNVMMSPYAAEIVGAQVAFYERAFVKPLVISAGSISGVTEARAEVTVRIDGRESMGRGAIYLSDLWSWPDPARTHAERDAVLRRLCERIAAELPALCGGEVAHPLTLGLRLHESVCSDAGEPPALARSICLSPFDAAIHDAVGLALNRSAFALYDVAAPMPEADRLFRDGNACAAISRLLRTPQRTFPAWLIVGYDEDLQATMRHWAGERGYFCFKLKLHGKDNAQDAARTAEVYRAAKEACSRPPRLCIDTNCANPDAVSVLDYLERLRALDAEAFAALEYIEQPTGRDIRLHRFDWRPVTRLKPVALDEGLTGLDVLEEAQEQGWSGLSLKTCKGHSFCLTAAAWARERGMKVWLQDLTNPGFSAIHAALFAAYVPTENGVELNAAQFTPAANAEWLPRLAALLEPTDGLHRLPETLPTGLGSRL